MPVESPRCLLSNSDSIPIYACGYDLTPQTSKAPGAMTGTFRRMERCVADSEMTKVGVAVGMVAVWIPLAYNGGRTGLRHHQGRHGIPLVPAPRGGVHLQRVESSPHYSRGGVVAKRHRECSMLNFELSESAAIRCARASDEFRTFNIKHSTDQLGGCGRSLRE
jgi:hypothetical protein